jgi:PAS domain S-box-containing protein
MKKSAPIPRGKPLRKETETQQSTFSRAVEQAGDIIYITDQEGVIEYVNPAFEGVTGYSKKEALGQTPRLLQSGMMPQDYYRKLWNTILAGEVFRAEVIDRKKNGELFHYDQTISPLKDSQGRITHFVSTGKDVTERKHAEQEIRLLLQLTRTIAEAENFDSALSVSLRTVCENTGWDFGEVWFLSADGKRLELGAPYFCKDAGLESFRSKSKAFTFEPGIGLPGRAWASGKAVWIPNVTVDANFPRAAFAKESGLRAAVGIPILDGDTVVAVMDFFMREARQEDERMVALISAVAAQLGTAFQRKWAQDEIARLHNTLEQSAEVIKKRLRESEALARISLSLSEAEHIGLADLLGLIAASAEELIAGAEQAVIHLLDEEEQILVPRAVAGIESSVETKQKMRPGEGIAGQAMENEEVINIVDVESDNRFLKTGAPPTFRSLMVAPIISRERKLGTISAQSKTPYAFTESDSSLLRTLGNQAAIALENARLLENTQQALKETNALYYINRRLNALNVDELLKDAVELLKTNFGYYHVQVYIIDPSTNGLTLRAATGEIGRQLCGRRHYLCAGTGIVGYAAEKVLPFFTNNVDETPFFIRNPLLPDTKAEMAVPIQSREKVQGILDIQQTDHKPFAQRDVQLVTAVADQLAIALQKAELYEHLQISLQQEKTIRSQLVQNERLAIMGRLLASVSHELNNPLQAIQNALFLLTEEKGISEQGMQDLEIVLAETERMADMIQRLRATYRPAHAEDFTPTQVNHLIEDVHALISTHLRRNEIAFVFQPDPALPYMYALSDQLRQVFLNLFMNAVEAMSRGDTLTVQAKYHSESEEIQIAISDTGTSISPDILAEIFEPFITDKKSGTGLGLTISRDIVIKHRGRITAENNPERGSTFRITLPLANREIE